MISLIFQPYSGVVTKHPIPYPRLAFILAETVNIVVQHTLKQNLPSFNLYYTPRVKSPAWDKITYLLATFRVYITITPFEIYEKTPGSHISHFVYLYYCLGLYTSLDQFSCLSVWIGRVLPSHINTLPRIQRGCPDGVMDITLHWYAGKREIFHFREECRKPPFYHCFQGFPGLKSFYSTWFPYPIPE